MKIKRTFAPDIRQAMRRVREEQGADAVILGNRKVANGVEILSAIDYDEEMLYENAARQEQAAVAASAGYVETPGAPARTYADVAASVPAAPAPGANAPIAEPLHEHVLVRPQGDAERARHAYAAPQTGSAGTPVRSARPPAAPQADPARSSVQRARARTAPRTPGPRATPDPVAATQREPAPLQAAPAPEPITPPVQAVQARAATAPVDDGSLDAPAPAPPAAASSRELESLRSEIKALRGLMENQLNVLEWDRLSRRHPTRVAALSRLCEMDIGTELARTLVDSTKEHEDPERTWRQVLAELANQIPISDDDFMSTGGVVALVGSTGVGKTTTVAKLAARFSMQHGQRNVALVTTDTYRVGAQEQLLHFAQIIGVPLYAAKDQDELGRVLARLCDKKLVLIDTAGMSQRDLRLTEQFVQLRDVSPLLRSYLVMSANTQLAALDEVVRAFGSADLAGCIITKLDEATSLGSALTVSIRHKLAVAYVGTGQRVPEDISPARAHRLVGRAVPLARRYAEPEDNDALAVRFAGAGARAGR